MVWLLETAAMVVLVLGIILILISLVSTLSGEDATLKDEAQDDILWIGLKMTVAASVIHYLSLYFH